MLVEDGAADCDALADADAGLADWLVLVAADPLLLAAAVVDCDELADVLVDAETEAEADDDVEVDGADDEDVEPEPEPEVEVEAGVADSLWLCDGGADSDSVADSLVGPVLPGARVALPSVARVCVLAAVTS